MRQASPELSPTELEVLRLLASGLSMKLIADWRGRSMNTIRRQLERIREKLGARNAPHAVALGFRKGLVE